MESYQKPYLIWLVCPLSKAPEICSGVKFNLANERMSQLIIGKQRRNSEMCE